MESYVRDHRLGKMVQFHGWMSREQLRQKYRDAHLLLITSRDEGMSLAMMEALASGLYVLTTPVSGSGELIREGVNGDFIPFRDPPQIADTLGAIYRNRVSKGYRVPDQLLHEIRDSISWDHYVNAYAQLIQAQGT
jgi:glycosyltransferase involved in cell wall biosynthesis